MPEVAEYTFKSRGVLEMLKKLMVASLQAKRNTVQNHQLSVQSLAASIQQAKTQLAAAVSKQSSHAGREARRRTPQRCPSSHRASCSCQVQRGSWKT